VRRQPRADHTAEQPYYTWPAKWHSSNIFGSVSTPGSDCRWNPLSCRSLQLSAELFQYSKNEICQHIVPCTDARTWIFCKVIVRNF